LDIRFRPFPYKGGLGLSGAEGARDNALFVEYLKSQHGDLADHVYLTSDAVATVAAAFEHGVILIAGTGSSCRVLLNDGRVFGVGGWGHQIGDGGSAFWIAMRAIRMIFDEDDGMEIPHESTQKIRELLLEYFNIEDKVDILEHLYSKFQKSKVALFTKELAKRAFIPVPIRTILQYFFSYRYRRSCSKQVILRLLGFVHAVQGTWIPKVNIYRPSTSSAIGAAVMVAQQAGISIPHPNCASLLETINFY
uniref:N-acetyl-D-glucosamine kinase n=1 Tax=Heligmosomoides polygyrus TaxID=6339 RepID=A0A183F4H7_HELPZ